MKSLTQTAAMALLLVTSALAQNVHAATFNTTPVNTFGQPVSSGPVNTFGQHVSSVPVTTAFSPAPSIKPPAVAPVNTFGQLVISGPVNTLGQHVVSLPVNTLGSPVTFIKPVTTTGLGTNTGTYAVPNVSASMPKGVLKLPAQSSNYYSLFGNSSGSYEDPKIQPAGSSGSPSGGGFDQNSYRPPNNGQNSGGTSDGGSGTTTTNPLAGPIKQLLGIPNTPAPPPNEIRILTTTGGTTSDVYTVAPANQGQLLPVGSPASPAPPAGIPTIPVVPAPVGIGLTSLPAFELPSLPTISWPSLPTFSFPTVTPDFPILTPGV